MAGKIETRPAKKAGEKVPDLKVETDIRIDYPREEELVIPGHYAIRLSGIENAQVEISINDEEWMGCRTAVGYYWFDWEPSKTGEVTIVARAKVGKGRVKKSDSRFCRIVGKK